MGTIGRPPVGPRVTFNITEAQAAALDRLAGDNRSEWIRDAIEQRIRSEALPVELQLAQDRDDLPDGVLLDALVIEGGGGQGDPAARLVESGDGGERWDAVVDVEPAEDAEPYDEALTAAGWLIVSDDRRGRQWVVRCASTSTGGRQ